MPEQTNYSIVAKSILHQMGLSGNGLASIW